MGKNKHKSSGRPKEKSVFKVAGSRVTKGKAKPVTTNLKRFNSKMQTEVINKRFTEVQSALVFKKKKEETKNENKKSSIQEPRLKTVPMDALPDVNSAAEELSKL